MFRIDVILLNANYFIHSHKPVVSCNKQLWYYLLWYLSLYWNL